MARRLPADPSEAIGTAVVKYNYQAQQPDELSLVKGSRILILEKSNDGKYVHTSCPKLDVHLGIICTGCPILVFFF